MRLRDLRMILDASQSAGLDEFRARSMSMISSNLHLAMASQGVSVAKATGTRRAYLMSEVS
jgi:hypothetical protein